MFNGYEALTLTDEYLDLSFSNAEKPWTIMTEGGSIRFVTFDIGDPWSGPTVLLGYLNTKTDEVIDWSRVDPLHCHGSDHFRATASGNYLLGDGIQIHEVPAGGFSFQEAGVFYRELPDEDTMVWLLHVVGDRRGIRAFLPWHTDRAALVYSGNPNDIPLNKGETYIDGLGERGIPAITTSMGSCTDGYLNGTIEELRASEAGSNKHAVETGLLGDRESGPVVMLLNGAANSLVSVPTSCETERVLFIAAGSCRVGDAEYQAGDARVQAAGSILPEIHSNDDGVRAVILIGDRRAQLTTHAADQEGIDWSRRPVTTV